MCRKDREVTDFNKILDIIRRCDCCRLGLYDNGGVYIVPMNFGILLSDGRLSLYFHSAVQGRKIDILKSGGRVGFEMDTDHEVVVDKQSCRCSFLYSSVIGSGNAVIVTDPQEKIRGLKLILDHYEDKSDRDFSDAVLERTAVIRLDITELSCKQHK